MTQPDLACDDVQHLNPGQLPDPYTEAALLVPLYSDLEQFGAIVFGRPVNGVQYARDDVDMLLYPCDQIAEAVQAVRGVDSSPLTGFRSIPTPMTSKDRDGISINAVEEALRNLYDFAYLGDSLLAELQLVHTQSPGEAVTHIDRGKAVYSLVKEAVGKLCPDADLPPEPVPREWYPYLILHEAYMEDTPNREIMAQLYISEGTFNRTRRSAVRSVTRILQEMEAALN